MRRDTTVRCTEVNPIIMEGEFALKTDIRKAKTDDGYKGILKFGAMSFILLNIGILGGINLSNAFY